MRVIRGFDAQNIVACFEEPNTLGDPLDFDAPRNAPAKTPKGHLPLIAWHSDFFQYQLQASVYTVNVTHPAVAGKVQTWGYGTTFGFLGDAVETNQTLITHSLGYEPLAFVVKDGVTVMSGLPVQHVPANGLRRTASSYVDNNVVGVKTVGISGYASSGVASVSLPAITVTYQVMLFVASVADPGEPLFGNDGNKVVLARGKINTDYLYARQVDMLESYFSLDLGRTVDNSNGAARIISGPNSWTGSGYLGSFLGSRYTRLGY